MVHTAQRTGVRRGLGLPADPPLPQLLLPRGQKGGVLVRALGNALTMMTTTKTTTTRMTAARTIAGRVNEYAYILR